MLYGKQFPRAPPRELLLARFPPPFPLLLLVLYPPLLPPSLPSMPMFAAALDMRADIADVRFMLLADLITSYRTATVSPPRYFFFFFFFFFVCRL